jgi:hypothetical protein
MYLPANSYLIYQNLQNFAFLKFSWSCMIIVDLKRLSYLLFFFLPFFVSFAFKLLSWLKFTYPYITWSEKNCCRSHHFVRMPPF